MLSTSQVAELFSISTDGKHKSRGSGYLISTDLVLTACHVIEPATQYNGVIKVRFFDENNRQEEWQFGELAWRSECLDVALVKPLGKNFFRQSVKPVSFGQPTGRHLISVEAIGFAEAVTKQGNRTDTLPIVGTCHPGEGTKSDFMNIKVTWLSPSSKQEWQGQSGSVLFAGDKLIGVVIETTPFFEADTLKTTKISKILEDINFQKTCQLHNIPTHINSIDSRYVDSIPEYGWEKVQQDYTREVLETWCRIEMTGLGLSGATGGGVLDPSRAFRQIRFKKESEPNTFFNLAQMLDLPCALVLGSPGMGKTGALKLLLYESAQTRNKIPIFIPFPSLVKEGSVTIKGIVNAISLQAQNQLFVGDVGIDFFWRILTSGKCCVAFDALDEIPTKADREKVLGTVKDLILKAPGNQYYISSRTNEYRDLPILDADPKDRFPKFVLTDYDHQQIRSYIEVWFPDSQFIADLILNNPVFVNMHPGPLLLNLMGALTKQGKQLVNEYNIYDAFIETTLESWEAKKGKSLIELTKKKRRAVIEELAWEGQLKNPVQKDVAVQAVNRVDDSFDEEEVLLWLEQRTGLIRKLKEGSTRIRSSYEFSHQQLKEFLAGCKLASMVKMDLDIAMSSIKDHLDDYWWHQVFRFSISHLQTTGDKHKSFLEKILDYFDIGDYKNEHTRLLVMLIEECDAELMADDRGVAILDKVIWRLVGSQSSENVSRSIYDDGERDLIEIAIKCGFPQALKVVEETFFDRLGNDSSPPFLMDKSVYALCKYNWNRASEALGIAIKMSSSFDSILIFADCCHFLDQDDIAATLIEAEFVKQLNEDTSGKTVFLQMLNKLDGLNLREHALALTALAKNTSNPFAKLESLVWKYQINMATKEELYRRALELLSNAPQVEKHSSDIIDDIIQMAINDWEGTGDELAKQLVSDALMHTAYSIWYAVQYMAQDSEIGRIALQGAMKIIKETGDRSRRNGLVSNMAEICLNETTLPILLDYLRDGEILRYVGHLIVKGLVDQGYINETKEILEEVMSSSSSQQEEKIEARRLYDENFKVKETSIA